MSGRAVRWLLSLGHRGAVARSGPPRLTIVRHHRVYAAGDHPLYRLGVDEHVLDAQLAALARAGLAPSTVAEGLARLDRGEPGMHVAFSFDDGYADNVRRALPCLVRNGARATFYLTTGLIETRRAPWWDELAHALETGRGAVTLALDGRSVAIAPETAGGRRHALAALLPWLRATPDVQRSRLDRLRGALAVTAPAPCELASWGEAALLRDAGMEIGAHTMTHPFLSLLEPGGQSDEIASSIGGIERRLGVRPTGLAYPNGDHDARTIEAARSAGLAYAVATRAGACTPGSPRFSLPRRGLSDGACLGPAGRFSGRLMRAELDGAFDRLRGVPVEAAS